MLTLPRGATMSGSEPTHFNITQFPIMGWTLWYFNECLESPNWSQNCAYLAYEEIGVRTRINLKMRKKSSTQKERDSRVKSRATENPKLKRQFEKRLFSYELIQRAKHENRPFLPRMCATFQLNNKLFIAGGVKSDQFWSTDFASVTIFWERCTQNALPQACSDLPLVGFLQYYS